MHERVDWTPLEDDIPVPIDMVLYCPECGLQHVDAPNPATCWMNPPHRSHVCQRCRCQWRPADVATNGVAQIRTSGMHDTWVSAHFSRERPFNAVQTIYALERAEASLRSMGEKLLQDLDYSAEFPFEDADLIAQVIALLKQP